MTRTVIEDPFPPIYEAVPEWVTKVSSWAPDEIRAACEDAADVIAGGAAMLWRSTAPKRRRRADDGPHEPNADEVAEAIARGLAILAHAPGGVTALGRHWCVAPHPDCAGPGVGLDIDFAGAQGTGDVYTPRSLAEDITISTLEPLVYDPGPLDIEDRDQWRLRTAEQILALRIADIAVGSGAFLVAGCRYLADRLLESWRAEGVPGTQLDARRAVTRCLYGVDINPIVVELCKIAVWLITYDRQRPHLNLDHLVKEGDSLLGLKDFDQLAWMHVRPDKGQQIHAAAPHRVAGPRRVATCITVLGQYLYGLPADSPEQDAARIALETLIEVATPIADLVVGAGLASSKKGKRKRLEIAMRAADLAASLTDDLRWDEPYEGPGMVPIVYAAPQTHTGWHVVDPTAEITPWGNPDPDRLPWVMCGLLRRPEEQWVFTQTPEPGDVVCRDCQTQVTACEALLAFLLRETARLASGSPAGSASPAPTNDREVA